MMSLPFWLPGPIFLLGVVSVSDSKFLRGLYVQGVSLIRDPTGQRPHWSETPLDRDPTGQRPPLTETPPNRDPP